MNKEASKYPSYIPSGIDWLGEIPAHWQLKPLKYVVDIDSEKLKDSEDPDLEIEYIDISSVDSGGNILKREKLIFENAPSRARRVVQVGDTILATVRTYLRAITQIDYDSDLPQICSTGFAVLRPVNIHDRYLFYWVRSDYFIDEIVSRSVGVSYPAISSSEVGNLHIPITPIEEQKAIATFLDQQTTRIDQLIEKKKRLLELLDEQRQAIITYAVTKGINPDVSLKDSGIDWLGEVPVHWDVTKVKRVGSIKYGLCEPPEKMDGGLPFIRATDIFRGIINSEKIQYINPDAVPWTRNPELKAKDILVVRSGAYTGDSAIVPPEFEGAIAGYDMVFTCNQVIPEFIANAFLSKYILEAQFHVARSRAAQPHLNAEELGNCTLLLPPIPEQKKIINFLSHKKEQIDQLKSKIQTAIDRLEEYRSSLITQAVTGKIDVRDTIHEVEMSYAAEEGELYKTNK